MSKRDGVVSSYAGILDNNQYEGDKKNKKTLTGSECCLPVLRNSDAHVRFMIYRKNEKKSGKRILRKFSKRDG